MNEIINKVANSNLQVFDLEEYYPSGIRTQIDISKWLLEDYILKEIFFRETLKTHDWKQYENHFVAIYCATDAIIPTWASILVTVYLAPYAKKVVAGTLYDLETALYFEIIPTIDYSKFQDKPVILKGCSKKPVPQSAYIMAVQKLQPFAKSIMYGEACSAVPLFKKSK
ncbi:DUF2480 family protein [Flavobacterium sp.]|uniref:DUF2480 family protein n=1 Tax=Flavobacterium sp. TaxID=239 RepID=UPI0025EF270D|nr:DUF2480 family protein [Flavobacterium sp.]